MGVMDEAAAALPQVFDLLGKKATFTLRANRKGITPGATVSGTRARSPLPPPVVATGYVTKRRVYLVAASIGTTAALLEDETIAWTVQKFNRSTEQAVEGPFTRFAPENDLIWEADLEGAMRNAPGGGRYNGV